MTYFTCKACGKPVKVEHGKVVRTDCAPSCDAPVIAHMRASATGEGGVR